MAMGQRAGAFLRCGTRNEANPRIAQGARAGLVERLVAESQGWLLAAVARVA